MIYKYCDGNEVIMSPRTMCNEVYGKLAGFLQHQREKLPNETRMEFKILLSKEVLERMKTDESSFVTIEKKFNTKLPFQADLSLHIENYKISDMTKQNH
jgi:Ribonuclease G/E